WSVTNILFKRIHSSDKGGKIIFGKTGLQIKNCVDVYLMHLIKSGINEDKFIGLYFLEAIQLRGNRVLFLVVEFRSRSGWLDSSWS
ncbi:hypothetical protein L9F63_003719, partial [Diploptera punctata]